MARPLKEGLDYFSLDVDFFENKKIRKVLKACGPASISVITCLLCNIYRWKGYYSLWDEELPFDIADKIGMSEGSVIEVVNKAVQVDFFNKEQFEKNKILTSAEIQKRFLAGASRRETVFIDDKYFIPDDNNPESVNENGQSKVKKRKESKGENGRAQDFYKKNGEEKREIAGPPKFSEVLEFFEATAKNHWDKGKISIEAQKFFNHYDGNGWKVNGQKIESWQAKGKKWILKELELKNQ